MSERTKNYFLKKLCEIIFLTLIFEVTDTGIRSLENMQRLKKLWLDETVVSDRAIDSLVKLRGLRELYIAKTRVTAAGRDRLRRQLPNCRLVETPP